MDSIVNDRYLLNERVLVKMLVFPVLFNIVVDILAITLIARVKEEGQMTEIVPRLVEDGLSNIICRLYNYYHDIEQAKNKLYFVLLSNYWA